MKELFVVNKDNHRRGQNTHMFPPSSLICRVTTASPIQTIEKTPAKTKSVCCLLARTAKNMLSSKQKIRGPLVTGQQMSSDAWRRAPQPEQASKINSTNIARHTTSPNPSTLHSNPPAISHQHQATSPPTPSNPSQSPDSPHHPSHPHSSVASHPTDTWATTPASSSPTPQTDHVKRCPRRFHQWYSAAHAGLRLVCET